MLGRRHKKTITKSFQLSVWSVTLALLFPQIPDAYWFYSPQKGKNTSFTYSSLKVMKMLQISGDYDLQEQQYHHCVSGSCHCCCHQGGDRVGPLYGEKKPWKGTCFASFHRPTILFCAFKLLLLCFLTYSLPLWMISQQRELSPLIPLPGNSRSL